MKFTYYFKDTVDVINSGILKKESYNSFVSEVKELNTKFNYSVYIFGSYLGYIIERSEYTDIDFIILSKKILEVNELTEFFKSFHEICKKYHVGYNLMYSTDKNEGDFDTNLYSGYLFKSESSKMIRPYKRVDIGDKMGSEFLPLTGTDLYDGLLGQPTKKLIEKMQMGVKFYTPIKIQ